MRSKLFVPATRPELFDKALAGEADAISFDLEDAVAPDRKGEARDRMRLLLEDVPRLPGDKTIIVRVNGVDTPHFAADLEAVTWPSTHVVNLPMLESADAVREAAERLDALERERGLPRAIGILANIESPRGLRLAAEIAQAHPRVIGLQIGYGDLFAPLGIASGEPAATQAVRVAVRMAAGEAGIAAFDGAFVNFSDADSYRRDCEAAQRLGFTGRSCIHPSQIATANAAFRPSQAEVDHALRVMQATAEHLGRGVGAFTVDGRLVDGPFITQAERLLALARKLGMTP